MSKKTKNEDPSLPPPPCFRCTEYETERRQLDMIKLRIETASAQRKAAEDLAGLNSQRIYTFTKPVDEESIPPAVSWIHWQTAISKDPLTIRFTSPGGAVLNGLALFDTLREVRNNGVHVTTISVGYTASMGGVLLQAGTVRKITKNSYLHIHEPSMGAYGDVSHLKDETKWLEIMWVQLSEILAERSKFDAKELRQKAERKEWWMTAKEALKYGFVDKVI